MKSWLRLLASAAVLVCACSPTRTVQERGPIADRPAQPDADAPAPRAAEPGAPSRLGDALAAVLEDREGTYGVLVEHVPTGERFERNQDRTFPAASVYKLPVAYEVLRRVDAGELGLDETLTVEPADAIEEEPEQGLALGEQVTVREALEAMMSVSSNAAAHALMRRVGRDELNRSLRAQGLRDTRVPLLLSADDAPADDEAADDEAGGASAVTTPADMAHLLRLLARDRLLREPTRAELRRLLALREDLDPIANSLPDSVQVLAKVGNLERASNVAGLVQTSSGPVIICIFDEDVDPGDARAVSADVARAVHDLFGQ